MPKFSTTMLVGLWLAVGTRHLAPQEAKDRIRWLSRREATLLAEVARLTAEKQEAEQRGYDAAKEQAAKMHDELADHAVEQSELWNSSELDDAAEKVKFWNANEAEHLFLAKQFRAMVRP